MTQMTFTEEQVRQSVVGAHFQTAISVAIEKADHMAGYGGCNMTVVQTKNNGLCIYNEFQMTVASDEITEEIYNTSSGFNYGDAA